MGPASCRDMPLDLLALPQPDLAALAALKLMVEVGAEVEVAFGTWVGLDRWSCLDFLRNGSGTIGQEPMDAQTLARARAWQAELGQLQSRPPRRRAPSAEAVSTFAALAAEEAEVERSQGRPAAPSRWQVVRRKEPCETDAALVVGVPGFAARPDPWPQQGATLTQFTVA